MQNYIKNIVIKKTADLPHSKIDLPRVSNILKRETSSKAFSFSNNIHNKKITKKFTTFIPFNNFDHVKLKEDIAKNCKSHLMASEINDKRKESNIGRKKLSRKNIKDNLVLNFVKKNIRDDSTVLNNPGQFYNKLFNDIMRNYSKVNIKKFQK